ncbi:hypothetical protein CARUB_v10018360mg [Capsella rubella]|uniref:Uncharacterized protein n=1 Tax=Capsella rubella TaxID=81985 RepID=R0HMC7_9BRAS|nr:hypothetical protein CARUB_v10018360mg [Capsella rubella]
MGREVQGLSCEDKCMFKCGGLYVPEDACINPCIREHCHKPPSHRVQSLQVETAGMRNPRE